MRVIGNVILIQLVDMTKEINAKTNTTSASNVEAFEVKHVGNGVVLGIPIKVTKLLRDEEPSGVESAEFHGRYGNSHTAESVRDSFDMQ